MSKQSLRQLVAGRIVEAMREIGILLLAFTPLDFAVGPEPVGNRWRSVTFFVVLAVGLFGFSVVFERRLRNVEF